MLKVKTIEEQLEEERLKNAELQESLNKAQANLDYVAMMTDVDIPSEDEEEVKE